jgi:hypothetical protein
VFFFFFAFTGTLFIEPVVLNPCRSLSPFGYRGLGQNMPQGNPCFGQAPNWPDIRTRAVPPIQ